MCFCLTKPKFKAVFNPLARRFADNWAAPYPQSILAGFPANPNALRFRIFAAPTKRGKHNLAVARKARWRPPMPHVWLVRTGGRSR